MSLKDGDPRDELAAMTFSEIGKRLGISHTSAQMLFYRGMKKLRANPDLMRCVELARLLERERKDYEW